MVAVRLARLVLGGLAAGALALGPGDASGAAPPAGRVKTVQGSAVVVRADHTIPAREGEILIEGDTLRTGSDGRLGATLRDGTRLSLGPDSEIRIDRFRLEPAQGQLGLAIRWVRGMLVYASGRIARLAPESVRIETPVAIIGIRGTRFAGQVEAE